MVKVFSRLLYFSGAIVFASLVAILIATISIRNLENSLEELNNSACNITTLEERLYLAYKELNKTINTLNSSNVIDDELKKKAYKFSMVQAIHMAIIKLKNGNDISNEINLINQFAVADLAIIANELKSIYNANIPANSFFISAITDLIYTKNSSMIKNHNLSAVDQVLDKFVKVENIEKNEDRDTLLFVLHSLEHNDTAHALDIIKKLSDRYIALKEIEIPLQLKNNVNFLLHQLMIQVLENA
ncbi:MAG: hypothetical protein MRQ07_00145 [Candidatus Midichloria sp.]|nr:hypothetical protein [Candidatus Midichloria sp.]